MNGPDWGQPESTPPLTSVRVAGVLLRPGDRVRLRPRGRSDIFDIALDGKVATIEAIEQDFENRIHLAVVIDDDPGRDLGLARHIGHRFFYSVEEVEPLTEPISSPPAAPDRPRTARKPR